MFVVLECVEFIFVSIKQMRSVVITNSRYMQLYRYTPLSPPIEVLKYPKKKVLKKRRKI